MWFKRPKQRPTEKRIEPTVRFVWEQDGQLERELKGALISTLTRFAAIRKAYLARVDFGAPATYNVVLCVTGPEDVEVVGAVGSVFSRFDTSLHLDILFLTAEQEAELASVCRPFYAAV